MILFHERSRHIQLESGFSTQTAMFRATHSRYTAAIQLANRLPVLSRSLTRGGRPGRPAGKSLLRIGGVTAIDIDEQGGPPPTTEKAPASINSSKVLRSSALVKSSSGWWSTSMQSTQGHPRASSLFSQRREPEKSDNAPGPSGRVEGELGAPANMNASSGNDARSANLSVRAARGDGTGASETGPGRTPGAGRDGGGRSEPSARDAA